VSESQREQRESEKYREMSSNEHYLFVLQSCDRAHLTTASTMSSVMPLSMAHHQCCAVSLCCVTDRREFPIEPALQGDPGTTEPTL
jgi:hypothetical protein